MTSAVHQRVPALVLLGFALLLAAGSFWLLELSNRLLLDFRDDRRGDADDA